MIRIRRPLMNAGNLDFPDVVDKKQDLDVPGKQPVCGSGPKLPSLASPRLAPLNCMPIRALRRAASSWLP
jgi:hypothetical protein